MPGRNPDDPRVIAQDRWYEQVEMWLEEDLGRPPTDAELDDALSRGIYEQEQEWDGYCDD